MAYTPVNWTNTPTTPLDAENLNHMESGVIANELAAKKANEGAVCFSEALGKHTHTKNIYTAANWSLYNGITMTSHADGGYVSFNGTANTSSQTFLLSLDESIKLDANKATFALAKIRLRAVGADVTVSFRDDAFFNSTNVIATNAQTITGTWITDKLTDGEWRTIWVVTSGDKTITKLGVQPLPTTSDYELQVSSVDCYYSADGAEVADVITRLATAESDITSLQNLVKANADNITSLQTTTSENTANISDLQTATAANTDNIKEMCDVTTTTISSTNLLNINDADFLKNKIIAADGSETENANNSTTGFMPCDAGDTIVVGSATGVGETLTRRNVGFVVLYDKNKTFLSRGAQYPFVDYLYTISDERAKYFRVVDTNSFFVKEYIMIAKSTTNVKYENFFETYKQLKNQSDVNALTATVAQNTTNISANTSNIADLQAFVGYTNDDILGLQVDYENKMFTRLAGAVGLTPGKDFDRFEMFGGRKRCNVLDDGTITAYFGDENYAEDGSNGQVMVYQPKFYYKVVPLKLDKNTDSGIGYHILKANYYVSATPHAGFKLHPAFFDGNGNEIDYILYSAYEGCLYSNHHYVDDNAETSAEIDLTTDLICSLGGRKPISGLYKPMTRTNLETLCKNHGTGWHLETIKSVAANQLLMIVEYATMNLQSAVGQGIVSIPDNGSYNCASLTGSTSALGNATGEATKTVNEVNGTKTTYTTSGKTAVSYRGIENPWGNMWRFVNGINIYGDGTMAGGQACVCDDYNFSDSAADNYKNVSFALAATSGFINAMGYGGDNYDWLLLGSESGGTSVLPVGDYIWVAGNLNGYRTLKIGGNWRISGNAGPFCCRANYTATSATREYGGRLLYVPTARI